MSDGIVPEGQEALEAPGTGTGSTAKEQAPFLKIDDSTFFNTPDEAIKAFREGTMRHSEHKKAMGALQSERQQHENAKTLWLRQQADFDEKIKLYKQVDELFKANPQAFQTVQQMLKQGGNGGGDLRQTAKEVFEEMYGPKIKEFEEYQKREQAKAERDRHFADLKGKYPDLDEKAIMKEWDQLMSPESTMGTMIELIYHGLRGRNPQKTEQKILDGLAQKAKAGVPTGAGAPPVAKKPKGLSMREIAEKAKREAGD